METLFEPIPAESQLRKRCFKCGALLLLGEFYAHPEMADGHVNKCKTCARGDVSQNRREKREFYAAYERSRSQTPQRKQQQRGYHRKERARHPEKYQARMAVSNAIRDGRLVRQPCAQCGAKAEAHHEDYSNPLEVRWLCPQHHREHHHGA